MSTRPVNPVSAPRRRAAALALVIALAAAAAGCGDDEDEDEPGGPGRAPVPAADLTLSYSEPSARTIEFRCAAPGRGGGRACSEAELRTLVDVLTGDRGLDRRVACAQVVAGPEELTVSGTVDGRRVADVPFTRRDACEDARYTRLLEAIGRAP